MNKLKSISIFAVAAVLGLSSCAKEEPAPVVAAEISLSQPTVTFQCTAGGSVTIDVKTTAAWTIDQLSSGVSRWLELDTMSGTGDGTVTLKCIEFNPFSAKRVSVLVFRAGEKQANLVVTQHPDPERYVSIETGYSDDVLRFNAELGDGKNVKIVTSKPWIVETGKEVGPEGWISLSQNAGEGESEITVNTVQVNEEPETRVAELNVRIDRVNSVPFFVSQPSIVKISTDKSFVELGKEADSIEKVLLSSNAKTKSWKLEGYTDEIKQWLSIDKTEGVGDTEITFKTVAKNDGPVHLATLVFKVDDIHYVEVEVKQKSSLEISANPESLEFAMDKAESKDVVITSTTTVYPWTIANYDDSVKAWLDINTTTYAGSTTVTFSTKGENRTAADRVANIEFHLTDDIFCTVVVKQPMIPLATKIISWAGDKNVVTLEGPDGASYKGFPYANNSSAASVTAILDGKGGAVLVNASTYTVEKAYKVWTDKNRKEFNILTVGSNTTKSGAYYYTAANLYQLRLKYSYIVIPAIEGYRLTHVFAKFGNGTDSNVFSICSNMGVATPTTVDGISKKPVSKLTDADFELTSTKANTAYWMYIDGDRLVLEFKFTLTEVRE